MIDLDLNCTHLSSSLFLARGEAEEEASFFCRPQEIVLGKQSRRGAAGLLTRWGSEIAPWWRSDLASRGRKALAFCWATTSSLSGNKGDEGLDLTLSLCLSCITASLHDRCLNCSPPTSLSGINGDEGLDLTLFLCSCFLPRSVSEVSPVLVDVLLPFVFSPPPNYTCSKTQSEKVLLDYDHGQENNRMEVVSLACGQVGGEALLPYAPSSIQVLASPLTGDMSWYEPLKFLQALLGSIPIVHIDDVCEAHVFCMEKSSLSGRFLCASAYPTMQEIVEYYEHKYPELNVIKEVVGIDRGIKSNSQKLVDAGFRYAYDTNQILDDTVKCMKRLEGLKDLP